MIHEYILAFVTKIKNSAPLAIHVGHQSKISSVFTIHHHSKK